MPAERCPLLIVVDDAHWLDPASAEALTFTARRLAAEAIALLFAALVTASGRRSRPKGLPQRELLPLNEQAALALLRDRSGTQLTPQSRGRLRSQPAAVHWR